MSVVGGQPKKHATPSYKATKHIESTFLISDYTYYLKVYMYIRALRRETQSNGESMRHL